MILLQDIDYLAAAQLGTDHMRSNPALTPGDSNAESEMLGVRGLGYTRCREQDAESIMLGV